MTAFRDETGLDRGLLDYLDEHELRYEVIDGSIVVSPPPGFAHGDVLGDVFVQLRVGAPAGVAVVADYAFFYDEPSFLIPDFLVAPRADCREDGIHLAPLLVVEVLSKSTRRRDVGTKWDIYAEAGVPSYWLVDPKEPALTVLTLTRGAYVETDRIIGGQMLHLEQPFPVDVTLENAPMR